MAETVEATQYIRHVFPFSHGIPLTITQTIRVTIIVFFNPTMYPLLFFFGHLGIAQPCW